MKTCTATNCGNKHQAHGFCAKHNYRRGKGYLYTEKEIFIRDNPPKDGIGLIPLTKGATAIVDENDYDSVISIEWSLQDSHINSQYACNNKDSKKRLRMHRFILGVNDDKLVDHINGNGLDNRRSNLRVCTYTGNARNNRKRDNTSSIYKGVSREGSKWKACIRFNKKTRHLAMCETQEEAAIYYDVAAQLFYGHFAKLNFPLNKCSVS